ncbi:hypothetical protein ABCS69_000036 [Providencia stuartii]|nr:hypothetical protein [Providencia stuartii]
MKYSLMFFNNLASSLQTGGQSTVSFGIGERYGGTCGTRRPPPITKVN